MAGMPPQFLKNVKKNKKKGAPAKGKKKPPPKGNPFAKKGGY